MAADMGGFAQTSGAGDGPGKGFAGGVGMAQLLLEGPDSAVEVEIAVQCLGEGQDEVERRLWAVQLGDGDGAVKRDDRRWLQTLQGPV